MPKKEVKSKEQSLETVLWNCRVALRTIGSLEKKRDAIISLCFLNFAVQIVDVLCVVKGDLL